MLQFNGEDRFTWINRDGEEKTVSIDNSECNEKKPIFAQDNVQITNKRDLPIQSIHYGMEFEFEQMKIIVGPIICQKTETRPQTQINEDDVTCQTLLLNGFTKSKIYTLKTNAVNNGKPYVAYCDMQQNALEKPLSMLQGPSGDQGPRGNQGLKGDQGLIGDQGLKGDKGFKGDQGLNGDQGLEGVQGLKGDQGLKGEQGLTGDQGLKGDQGIWCPTSTDSTYELVGNKCFHFFNTKCKTFVEAKEYCKSKTLNGSGKLYEPKTTSHLDLMHQVLKRRAIKSNCIWLGIDDASTEGTYTYSSDKTLVDPGVNSVIQRANSCDQTGSDGYKDCDYVYTCKGGGTYTIDAAYSGFSIACEV